MSRHRRILGPGRGARGVALGWEDGDVTDVQLALMGPPHVLVDGRPLDVDTRKAIAVLALVAVDGAQSRHALARMLWPDSDASRARAALRRTLSVLGRGLGNEVLQAGRDRVGLAGEVACDVARMGDLLDASLLHDHAADDACPLCRDRLEQATGLYRGELLEGFALRDSPEFDDWRTERGEHLRRRLCQGLDLLGRLHLAAGDLDAAAAVSARWVQVDPLNEQVHRRLMLLESWRGRRTDAIERYRTCVTVLDRELGVTPMARTTDLYRAILENRVPAVPGRDDDPAFHPAPVARGPAPTAIVGEGRGGTHGRLPLVGRDDQLAWLLSARVGAPGRVLVVSGEAGVGKTRLVDELAATLRGDGTRVAAARCHPGEIELAFGPVVDLLEQAVGQVPMSRLDAIAPWQLAEAARLVPGLLGADRGLPSVAPLSSPGAQARLFDAVWEVLELCLAIDGPGVVVLDDLHAIDAASLDLLAYGLRRLEDRDLTVVACLRPEEVVDDHPVRRRLLDPPDIRTRVRELELDRLDDHDVDALVRAALERRDVDGVAAQIRHESEGLPLLVVEYLRLLQDTAEADDGAPVDLADLVPHGAAELARRRLGHLSETARQVASTAATIGRSFDLSVVLRASGRTEDEAVEGLDELLARQIVRELPGEGQAEVGEVRYDFVHDKLRQAIRDRTSLARRRLLHRRVADALTAGTRGGRDTGAAAALIADHHRRGGREPEAAHWFRRAGDHARSLFANREALDHYRRALALDDTDAAELRTREGEVCTLLGDYPAALAALELAAARTSDDATLAMVEHRLGTLYLRLGDLTAAATHLDSAAGRAAVPPAEVSRIHADRALLAVRAGDLDAAEVAAAAAREHGDPDDHEAAAKVHNLQGLIARHRGDSAMARQHFAASAHLAADLDDPSVAIAAMNNLARTEADAGDLDAAIARATKAVAQVVRRGDRHREAALRNNLADLLHRAGREEEAMAALRDAVTIFADVGQDAGHLRPEIWQLVEW